MKQRTDHRYQAGFTLVEVVMTITLMSILLGFVTMNLLHAQQATTVDAAIDRLTADMKQQQEKAMEGMTDSGSGSSYGVHLEDHSYILFTGASYDPSASTNYPITFDDGITFGTSPIDSFSFSQQSGEITTAPLTITVTNADGSIQKTITLNRLGVITAVQ